MLDFMRKRSQSLFVYVMFGAIIFVFAVNFGPGSSANCGAPSHTWAARVDGEMIPQPMFTAEYRQRLDYMRRTAQASGFELTPALLKSMKLREQIMDQLVNERVLANEAARRGLVVTDAELLKHLKDAYKVDSVEYEVYRRWVQRTFQMDVGQFEQSVRQQLLADKIRRTVSDTLAVSDDEVRDQFNYDNDTVTASVVRFDPSDVDVPKPDDAAVTTFLSANEKRVRDIYDADKLKYRQPKTTVVRQILKSVPADAADDVIKASEKAMEDIKAKIKGGAAFADVAKTDSDDASTKEQGGLMGTFRPGEMVPALDAAIANLKEGELSAVIKTRLGFHLLLAEKVEQPRERSFDEAKQEIASGLIAEESRSKAAQAQAEALLAALKSGQALEALTMTDADLAVDVSKKKPVRTEVGPVHRGDETLGSLGKAPEVRDALFALPEGQSVVDGVKSVEGALVVVVRKERKTPNMDDFKAQLETLRDRALFTKRREVTDAWIKSLREASKIEINTVLTADADAEGKDV